MMIRQKALKSSKKAWAGRFLPVLAITFSLALVFGIGAGARANVPESANIITPDKLSSHNQSMVYQVYAGGIHAVEAVLDLDYENKERYNIELFAKTRGFLGKLVPWEGTFETHGWRLKDGGERPELHKSTAYFDDEYDMKEYTYTREGGFKSLRMVEAGEEEPAGDLSDDLVQGTTDALTASLQAMKSVAATGVCAGEDEVFDGKRRFKIVFRHKADDDLDPTRYNVYDGIAARCEVEVIPMAGAWHKKPRGWASIQEQGRDKGSLPTVWLAKIDDKGPAVPVKMRVKTDYGTLFMHLTEYKNGDKIIRAAKEDD